MEECIKKAAKKDEAYSAYADIIYQKAVYKGDSIYSAWNIDKAIEMIRKAYSINALPAYKHQEAQYSYFKGDYQQALSMFLDLTKTNINSGELYYEAAQSKAQLNAPAGEIEVETSLGKGIVCDTGSFTQNSDTQLDIATDW